MNRSYNLLGFITLIAVAGLSRSDLTTGPVNEVVHEGSATVTLRCTAAAAPANHRIMWTEFTNSTGGRVISDNRAILGSHPNAARYAIRGSGLVFDLEISDVDIADGGRYLCQDINGSPPAFFRSSAELIVLESDPVCQEFSTTSGAVVEGRYYHTECAVRYNAELFTPNKTWTGPGDFDIQNSVTDSEVWSMSAFTAHRSMEGERFECLTSFRLPASLPSDGATNVPTYQNTFTGITLVVIWPPTNVKADPIKDIYEVGDEIICSADSKPASTYRWTNLRTQVAHPVGAVLTITEDLQGFDTPFRCSAVVLLDGSIYPADGFINVTVPAATTPTTPTTTPITTTPSADGPCGDLTGHWASTNPNAHLCIERDFKGNLLTLIRNGSDPYFVAGNGKTQVDDYKHVGFTSIWPPGLGGVGGFTGECHSCHGTEVILLSGLSRDKSKAPGCGESDGTGLTNLYVLTRFGPPCRAPEGKVYRASKAHIKRFGLKPEQIMKV